MVSVDLGEHGLRRDEHHRAVGGFARDDVFPCNVVDVLADIGLELLLRERALHLVRLAVEHAVVVLQGKLRVHRHQSGGRRKAQRAVDAHAVGECEL